MEVGVSCSVNLILLKGDFGASSGDSLIFSTYLGASGGANYAHGIAIDKYGCIYIAGNTTNPEFPTTAGAFDEHFKGPVDKPHGDAFVVKLNPEGDSIIYSTFIGGTDMDLCGKIAVDDNSNVYLLGTTSSADFPVTSGAFDTTFNGGEGDGRDDLFVAKLNADGSKLIYCTYIGGSKTEIYGANFIIDDSGCVYITGTTSSEDFPTTSNSYDSTYNGGSGFHGIGDAFIVKLNPSGSALLYSSFLGGSGDDYVRDITFDNHGKFYLSGWTKSVDFPITKNAYSKTMKASKMHFLPE